jgi:hypothetical protein
LNGASLETLTGVESHNFCIIESHAGAAFLRQKRAPLVTKIRLRIALATSMTDLHSQAERCARRRNVGGIAWTRPHSELNKRIPSSSALSLH